MRKSHSLNLSHFKADNNSLDLFRFVLASGVVISHCFPIDWINSGIQPLEKFSNHSTDLGNICVLGFMVISGFLITRSYEATNNLFIFSINRFLRIYPAFVACLIFTTFLLAPISYFHITHTLHGYFTQAHNPPLGYLYNNGLVIINQHTIGQTLNTAVYSRSKFPIAWNGSLWTLPIEIACYALIAIIGRLQLLKKQILFVILFFDLFLLLISSNFDNGHGSDSTNNLHMIFMLTSAFIIGAIMCKLDKQIIVNKTYGLISAIIFITSIYLSSFLFLTIGIPCLAYLLLASSLIIPGKNFSKHGDISYGIYLYGFPIAMFLSSIGVSTQLNGVLNFNYGQFLFIIITVILTYFTAVLSWYLIEKRTSFIKIKIYKIMNYSKPKE